MIIDRRYFVPESELLFSSTRTWGMLGFAFIIFIQSLGGIYAAWEAIKLKEENPWEKIDISKVKDIESTPKSQN